VFTKSLKFLHKYNKLENWNVSFHIVCRVVSLALYKYKYKQTVQAYETVDFLWSWTEN